MPSVHDFNHKFLFDKLSIRGQHLQLHKSLKKLVGKQAYPEQVKALLGELAAASALFASSMKTHGRVSLQVRGKGPLKILMAESTHLLQIRGIARVDDQLPAALTIPTISQPDAQQWLGEAQLAVTLEPKAGQRYQGIVPINRPTLSECLEHYFNQSEQLATRLWISTNHKLHAGALLLQRLPEAHPENTTLNEDDWNRACLLADTVTNKELITLSSQRLLRRLFHEDDIRLQSAEPITFGCTCNRSRTANAIKAMGVDEIAAMLNAPGNADITCQFCNTHYHFTGDDLQALIAELQR